MFTDLEHGLLRERYEELGATADDRVTASDYQLRELEIDFASSYIQDGDKVLDVGCGTGYSLRQYAKRHAIEGSGIDYASSMVRTAVQHAAAADDLRGGLQFQQASVLDLPFPEDHFDVITSARCLMALLDWEKQKDALRELHRVLRPGGVLVLMEGTQEGLDRLNQARSNFDLPTISGDGRDRLLTLKFDEPQLIQFGLQLFDLSTIQRFGMYYFLTRIVHPLLVSPSPPRYDAPINAIAREIARQYPNFMDLGHLAAFVWRKRISGYVEE